ncbi:MAG: helix-hairpin-helix domain-containing protein [Clostridia bacterium]|nr:helix-hairpin-helix domain-containing protein [Clostridia bacterium]
MIEFLKQRKIVIIIGILVIILVGWKIYDSKNFDEVNSDEILASNSKESTKGNAQSNEKEKNEDEEEEMMAVHVTGEVKNPGVVKVKQGSRIEDIIKAAGGLTENADITDVNLAYVVEDGMKIRIPSNDDEEFNKDRNGEAGNGEESRQEENTKNEYITQDSGKVVIVNDYSNSESLSSVININTANENELEELPGIGPSLASRIVEHRNQNGKFKVIEDIKNVTGIGDSKFEKIKNLIKVK